MGFLRPDMPDAEERLEVLDRLLTHGAIKTRQLIRKINREIEIGVLDDIVAAAGSNAALMLQIYNKMLDLVEEATSVRPTAYLGHAENPIE